MIQLLTLLKPWINPTSIIDRFHVGQRQERCSWSCTKRNWCRFHQGIADPRAKSKNSDITLFSVVGFPPNHLYNQWYNDFRVQSMQYLIISTWNSRMRVEINELIMREMGPSQHVSSMRLISDEAFWTYERTLSSVSAWRGTVTQRMVLKKCEWFLRGCSIPSQRKIDEIDQIIWIVGDMNQFHINNCSIRCSERTWRYVWGSAENSVDFME